MEEYIYNEKEKENCWYKSVCKKDKCDDSFCIRHYKMDNLIHLATLEGKQKYTVNLIPQKEDYASFLRLKQIKDNILDFVKNGKNLLIYSRNTGNGIRRTGSSSAWIIPGVRNRFRPKTPTGSITAVSSGISA